MPGFRPALLPLTLLLASPLAHAQDTVVTIMRQPLPISRIGQSLDVLTAADIQSYQSLFVADLLTHTTDLSLTRNGGPGEAASASIRGAGADHTLYILDGIRLNDPSQVGGGTNLGLIDTGDAARIEVLRGPLSTLWGSGALGGVVNIVSRTAQAPLEGDLTLEGLDHYGAARLGLGGIAGKLNWRLSAGGQNDQGVSAFAGGNEKDGFAQSDVSARAGYAFSDTLKLNAVYDRTHSRNDYDGYPAPDYVFADTGDFGKTDTNLAGLGLTQALAHGEQALSLSATDTKRDDYNADGTPSFLARGQITAADYHISYDWSGTRLLGGLAYERDWMRNASPSSYDPDPVPLRAAMTQASVYGQVRHDFGIVDMAISARHDDSSSFGGQDIAQASLVAPLGTAWRLHASAGLGVKVPSLYQLYSDYGSADLVPEKGVTLDGGLDYSFASGTVGATVFSRTVRDQIDFVACAGDRCTSQPYGYYANIDRTRASGLELELTKAFGEKWRLKANYSFLHTRNESAGVRGNRLPRTPDQMGSADLSYQATQKLSLGLGVRHVGASFDDVYNATPLKAYSLADLRADYALTDRVSLFGRIENAGDTRYQTAAGYGQLGRRLWLGVHTRLF
ncbi:TonB-dependent receptor [Asticcacaulis sp. EMRT-3]|uniref:TonB-dependent receptor plug domain-containing protein n=1 Tax=Asticcacaulis sp. EMRT-3 TaxID=3040349 RepID=UPI0024AEF647|nr:TonB-dependent receptor [Asticcacaulis sp. EMRT-3]MDI7773948.1 TonB-dependent receptor [Asticcacaulis sp. EMRT-3]